MTPAMCLARALSFACPVTDQTSTQPMHATAVTLDGRGVLITGSAGSGKTSLALTLVRRARTGGLEAGLIADDRVFLGRTENGILMSCPPELAGKAEARGYGIVNTSAIMAEPTPLALMVALVPEAEAQRYQVDHTVPIDGLLLPAMKLPQGPPPTAPTAIFSALGLPVWL